MAGSKKYDKSKPDQSGYRQLKQDIRDKNLGKLYFLHGEETYLRDYYFGEMKKQLLDGGMGTFNLHQLEGKELSPHKLEEVVDCLPMMADRTLIVVSDFDFFKAGESDREKYGEIFENLPDYCCLVAIYDLVAFKSDARLKLSKTVKKSVTSSTLHPRSRVTWWIGFAAASRRWTRILTPVWPWS